MDCGAHDCDIIRWLTGAEATLVFAHLELGVRHFCIGTDVHILHA